MAYSFDIINWMSAEIKKMDTKVRMLITSYKMHQLRADIENLYVKRENGGRGLIQQQLTDKATTLGLKKYLDTTTNWIL